MRTHKEDTDVLTTLEDTEASLANGRRMGRRERALRLKALQARGQTMAAIVESTPAALFVADVHLIVRMSNPALQALTSLSRNELVGRPLASLFGAGTQGLESAASSCLTRQQTVCDLEAELPRPGQQGLPVRVGIAPFRDAEGLVAGIVGAIWDISREKARAHHAAEEAARLQGILDHLAEPFFTVDRDLTITYMNEACARAVGYEPAEAVGRLKCKDVFRSDICETNCAVQRCMRTGEAISGARVTIRNRRGDAIPILATVSTLTDAAGNVVGGYELVRDFTAEALVEGAVREATEQITSATGQVARGITETTQAAEQISVGVQGIAEEMASVSSAASLGTEAAVRGSQAALATVHSMDSVRGAAAEIVEGMRALNVKAEEIGRIIEVIDGVADQTNLLALNAAIEAARAGEHGKGFAVVADEVRKLAERAADATREVNDLLQGIRQLVEQRTHDVETTARAIEESVCQVTDTAQVFDEVAEAIRQTHSSAQSVAATVEQLSASAEEMSASFEEIAASAQELAGMAESLDAAAARLQGAG